MLVCATHAHFQTERSTPGRLSRGRVSGAFSPQTPASRALLLRCSFVFHPSPLSNVMGATGVASSPRLHPKRASSSCRRRVFPPTWEGTREASEAHHTCVFPALSTRLPYPPSSGAYLAVRGFAPTQHASRAREPPRDPPVPHGQLNQVYSAQLFCSRRPGHANPSARSAPPRVTAAGLWKRTSALERLDWPLTCV